MNKTDASKPGTVKKAGAPVRTATPRAAPAKAQKLAPAIAAPQEAAAKTPTQRYGLPQLCQGVQEALPLVSKCTTERVVRAVFEVMAAAYAEGKVVNIPDFGKIEIKHRPARMGRNPATGAAIEIPAKTVPKFTFAKKMKEVVPS